jgi:hypothetical protein
MAMNNIKNASSDYNILYYKNATVNDLQGKLVKFTAKLQGINFTYLAFYYASEKGSFQFLTFTSNNLYSNYEKDLMDLISGFKID